MGLIHKLVTVKKPGDTQSLKEALLELSDQACDWNDREYLENAEKTGAESLADYYSGFYAASSLPEEKAIDQYVNAWVSSDLSIYVPHYGLDVLKDADNHVSVISVAVETYAS